MSLFLTRFPGSESTRDWKYLFGRYGRVTSVKYVHPYWSIDFKDVRDAADALRNEQGRMINGVRLVFTDERPESSKNPIAHNTVNKAEVSSLRLLIQGEVTLINGYKVNIEPIEINVPIKY